MNNKLYIPKTIRIGFRERLNTLAGKGNLAYIIYFDENKKIRKSKSWDNWRDHTIEPIDIENKPRSGYLINREIKHFSYSSFSNNQERVKIRIYSPDDFEVEISPENIVSIIAVSDINKREIIEECVYAWDDQELVLLPLNSDEYRESIKHSEALDNFKENAKKSREKIDKSVGFKKGSIFTDKKNNNYYYLGRVKINPINYKGVNLNTLKISKFILNKESGWIYKSSIKTVDAFLSLSIYRGVNFLNFRDLNFREDEDVKKIDIKSKKIKEAEDLLNNYSNFDYINLSEDGKEVLTPIKDICKLSSRDSYGRHFATFMQHYNCLEFSNSINGYYLNNSFDLIKFEIIKFEDKRKLILKNVRTDDSIEYMYKEEYRYITLQNFLEDPKLDVDRINDFNIGDITALDGYNRLNFFDVTKD